MTIPVGEFWVEDLLIHIKAPAIFKKVVFELLFYRQGSVSLCVERLLSYNQRHWF